MWTTNCSTAELERFVISSIKSVWRTLISGLPYWVSTETRTSLLTDEKIEHTPQQVRNVQVIATIKQTTWDFHHRVIHSSGVFSS